MSSRHDAEIRVGTRASRLARWQAEWVASSLRSNHPGLEVSLVNIRTHGDQDQTSPLVTVGGIGLFTKELQCALLDERVDIAVHSLKDLPTSCPEGLVLAAVPHREDVFDALIAPTYRTLQAMPSSGGSRHKLNAAPAQILYGYPQVDVIPVRGNIETRLNFALDGKLSGVLLAYAGLHRLNLEHHVTERLGPPSFLPAAGQGALGIECRVDDACTLRSFKRLIIRKLIKLSLPSEQPWPNWRAAVLSLWVPGHVDCQVLVLRCMYLPLTQLFLMLMVAVVLLFH